jgi:hypothetical protein
MARRGQAALEFLTTYGWAFLVVLAMIGALAYFGVLEPTKFLPQRCQFGTELHCSEFAINDTNADSILFRLNNALPETIYFNGVAGASMQFKKASAPSYYNCAATSSNPANIPSESFGDFVCIITGEDNITANTRERVQIKLTYSVGSGSYSSTYANVIYGEVYANSR